MANNKCNIRKCNLDAYQHHNECILHCKKSTDSFHYLEFIEERDAFYQELKAYTSSQSPVKRLCFIHFPRIDTQGTSYETLLNNEKIQFDNCYFYGESLELESEVFFIECSFKNNWELQDYKVLENVDNVVYSKCIFEKDVTFSAKEFRNENGIQIINDLSQSQFSYYCKFEGQLTINNAIIKKNIFNDNQKNFLKNNLGGKVSFNNCEFKEDQVFYIVHNANTDFLFDNCSFQKKLKIRNIDKGTYEQQQKNKAKLKSLRFIDCKVSNGAYLRVGFLEIGQFELSNLRLPQNAELNIGDCHFYCFKLTNFRNIGKFKLYKINVLPKEHNRQENYNPRFQIDNTSIGKTDFQSINLNSFARVIMFDNIFVGLKYTNINWGEFGNKKEIEVDQFHENETFKLEKQQDTYRTLKNVAIANNDQPQAMKFYAKEMENHYQLVKWNNFATKITLFFNKWSNGFGLNWGWQLLFLIIFAVAMYCALISSIDVDYHQLKNCESEDNIWGNFVNFVNPIHSTEFIFKDSWEDLTYTIDLIFRIIEGLMLYQIIQAFRKYSRKL